MTNKISKVIHNGTEFEFESVNGGVTSVNGDTGAVTVNDVKKSATAPSSPSEGTVWYDTTNDQLKVYDGSQWNITGKEYNAGEGISIGTVVDDYSVMQGPCPSGFHVPVIDERSGLVSIMKNSLSITAADDWKTKLHMPYVGERAVGGTLYGQGSAVYFWSNTPYTAYDPFNVHIFRLQYGVTNIGTVSNPSEVLVIRAFKDEYVAPDSTWTVIYGTLGSAGIFWNQSEGLISITDGTTGYTIADKNCGATTTYSDGDTLTESNMGKMYQWGNNYGFPSIGAISNTSSTKVDASAYGPWDYYNSSTFITSSSWDSSSNTNLWGWRDGVVENIITNTGVLSVNGQTGNVIVDLSEASGVTTTPPENPVAGSTYFDTINNVLRIYDGTQWIDYGNPDLSNYLAKDNTTAFTPSGDYNPATKKYVDDHSGIINDTTGTTTTVQKIRAGSTTEYNAVTKQEGIIYHVYE